jgi:hypothetical protein
MADFDEQEYKKIKMLEAMENIAERRAAKKEAAQIAKIAPMYEDRPSNVVDMPKKKISQTKKLETLSGINQALENPDVSAKQKLQLRDHAINMLKDEGYTDEQLSHAKGKMKAKIDKGRFKKFGAIGAEGVIGDSLKKGGKKGLKTIPLIGPLAAAAMSGDVTAAIPVLDMADDVGAPTIEPGQKMPTYDFGEYSVKKDETDEQARARIAALKALKNR